MTGNLETWHHQTLSMCNDNVNASTNVGIMMVMGLISSNVGRTVTVEWQPKKLKVHRLCCKAQCISLDAINLNFHMDCFEYDRLKVKIIFILSKNLSSICLQVLSITSSGDWWTPNQWSPSRREWYLELLMILAPTELLPSARSRSVSDWILLLSLSCRAMNPPRKYAKLCRMQKWAK